MTVKKEIRQILLGYISFEDKHIVAADGIFRMRSLGVFNNSGAARILGVTVRTKQYRIPKRLRPTIRNVCEEAFLHLGRRVLLRTAPDTPAIFYSPFFFYPSVLTASQTKNDILEISVYTARGLSVPLTAWNAFRNLKKQLPDGFESVKKEKKKPPVKAEKKDGKGNTV